MPVIRDCPACGRSNRIPAKHRSDVGKCGAYKAELPASAARTIAAFDGSTIAGCWRGENNKMPLPMGDSRIRDHDLGDSDRRYP